MNNNISAAVLVPCRLKIGRFQGSHAQIIILLASNSSEDEQRHASMKSVNFEGLSRSILFLYFRIRCKLKHIRNILEVGDTLLLKIYIPAVLLVN